MIRFCCSNRLEALVEALAGTVGAGRTSLFDPVNLVVPNTLVEGYVKQGLARRLGIAANVETRFLRSFLRQVAATSSAARGATIVDRDLIEGALLGLFHDFAWLNGPELGPVRDYLAGRRRGRARSQAGPAGGRAGGAVRRVRVLPPRDAGGLAGGGARSRGRSGAAALAARALAGPARSARPVHRQGDGDAARVLRPDAGREAPAAARGAPVRDLVRRPPLRLDLRDAGARDRAARLHPQPRPRGGGRGAGGVRSGRFAAGCLGAPGARQRPAAHAAGRRRGRRALRRPAVGRARAAAGGVSSGGARAPAGLVPAPRAPTTTA